MRDAIEMVAKKTLRGSLVTAWFCWISGAVFLLVGAIAALAYSNIRTTSACSWRCTVGDWLLVFQSEPS
jgi:hypothetical protein